MERLLTSNLLGEHSADELKGWVLRLHHFAFIAKGYEDHYVERESLTLSLKYDGHDDLVKVLDKLGVLEYADEKYQAYLRESGLVLDADGGLSWAGGVPPAKSPTKFRYMIREFPDLIQPAESTVADGASCIIRVFLDEIVIYVQPPGDDLTEQQVADAEKIEALLDASGFGARIRRIDGPDTLRDDNFT